MFQIEAQVSLEDPYTLKENYPKIVQEISSRFKSAKLGGSLVFSPDSDTLVRISLFVKDFKPLSIAITFTSSDAEKVVDSINLVSDMLGKYGYRLISPIF